MSTGKKKKIVWVRHTTPDVIPGTCYGQTDVPLKASFEEEALRCAGQTACRVLRLQGSCP